jgi:hypothetical protein
MMDFSIEALRATNNNGPCNEHRRYLSVLALYSKLCLLIANVVLSVYMLEMVVK